MCFFTMNCDMMVQDSCLVLVPFHSSINTCNTQVQNTHKKLPQEPLKKSLKILKKSANLYHTIQPLSSQTKCPNLFLKSSGTYPAQEPEDLVPGPRASNSTDLQFFFEFILKFYALLICLMSSNVFKILFRTSLTYHMQALMHKSLYAIFKA